jgi:hypothetical protein
VVNATPRPLYPRERPGTHYTGCWVGLRARLNRCGKHRPHRSPDLPPRSESLYRLSYPGPQVLRQKAKYTEDEPIDIPEDSRTPMGTTNSVISHALPRKQTIHEPAESSGAVNITLSYRTQSNTHPYSAVHRKADTARLHEFRLLPSAINRTRAALRDERGIPRTVSGKHV